MKKLLSAALLASMLSVPALCGDIEQPPAPCSAGTTDCTVTTNPTSSTSDSSGTTSTLLNVVLVSLSIIP